MKVEIWSDVMCPFCYIGKRHFESAMNKLPFANEIEVEWKSFQLNPNYHNTDNEDLYSYLARAKGMSVALAKQMTGQVVNMAAQAGITLDFDKNIPANSFKAHQLLHFAKTQNLQNEAEEALFEAHFIYGKDIAKVEVLLAIAVQLGLDAAKVKAALEQDEYAEAVRFDSYESQQFGISGVPYFIFDRKYALSGAQPVETFESALAQSFKEWKAEQPVSKLNKLITANDASCTDDSCSI